MVHVQQFLEHIHVHPQTDQTLLLKHIHKQSVLTIPFENLDIHLNKPLSINPKEVFDKVVRNKRGGLCFETNSLLYTILTKIGFEVRLISGAFWNETQESWNKDCTHLALCVEISGKSYLADIGIGGGFFEPLLIEDRYTYKDHNGEYQVVKRNDEWIVQEKNNNWQDLFKFSLQSRKLEDFYGACRYYEQDSTSFFRQKKLCSVATKNGKISLSSNTLKITNGLNKRETAINSEDEFRAKLKEYFDIVL
ncbi:arylamine N-acetyltransferase family protein [Priestia flexa]|uniref:arylamine N-acetyltransferase family protein n=1 Tax=Priestia flexa TaxID=86664 RepID=UPI001B327774|nr:arylamine N-acetyltransferase [Priestia flexa]